MSTSQEVREFGSVDLSLDASQVSAFVGAARSRLSLTKLAGADLWRITASSYVGTVSIPGLRLLIRPKATIENLLHLLGAGSTRFTTDPAVFDYERTRDLVPAFATLFASVAEETLTLGLPRAYQPLEEELISLRGRIDVQRQARTGGLPLPVACRFDEHTADTPVNRVARFATERLARMPGVTDTTRQSLRRLLARFEDVGALQQTDVLRQPVFTRLDRHMEPLDRLARLVIDDASLAVASGQLAAPTFLIDMNAVFERFVEESLRRALRKRLSVSGQETFRFNRLGAVPKIKPDLVFRTAGELVFVGDSKYKLVRDSLGRGPDYYQLLAYVTTLDVSEGVLVYCQDDGDAPPREVQVPNSEKRLWAVPISLDGRPADVDREIARLASFVIGRLEERTRPVERAGQLPAPAL